MKRISCFVVSTFLVINALSAEFEDNLGEEELVQPAQVSRAKPFSIVGEYDYIGKSQFSDEPYDHQNVLFSQGTGTFRSIFVYSPQCRQGIMGELGYSNTIIDWENNPFYSQDNFNTFNIAATFFTEKLDGWLWTFRFALGYDVDRRDFWEATVYDTLLWGRYKVNGCWGVHFGFLAQTGMRIDHVYPIFGVDWKPNSKWEVNLVYPVDLAIVYNWNCNWAFALAGRFWDSRFRLGPDETISNGLIVYRNAGAEAEIRYQYNDWISAEVHAGYTAGGQVKIANKQYQNKMHFDFGAAPYAGGDITISF